jgi:hypothetical protein
MSRVERFGRAGRVSRREFLLQEAGVDSLGKLNIPRTDDEIVTRLDNLTKRQLKGELSSEELKKSLAEMGMVLRSSRNLAPEVFEAAANFGRTLRDTSK